jgi:c-di-GMP-binding flagellar brake protein YcgR
MSSLSERRTQLRVEIPESETYSKPENWYNLVTLYNGPGRLIDLSKSGAGFETAKQVEKDELLRLKIDIPGEDTLVLKGQVRWTASVEWNSKMRVGVQFAPFGERREYNSTFALMTLQVLQEKYV